MQRANITYVVHGTVHNMTVTAPRVAVTQNLPGGVIVLYDDHGSQMKVILFGVMSLVEKEEDIGNA